MSITATKNKKRTRPRSIIPIGELPNIELLDEVFDTREPGVIGKFQKWYAGGVVAAYSGGLAIVKFPGARPRYIPARYIRRVSDEIRERARLERLCRRQEAIARANTAGGKSDMERVAEKFGLSVKEYLEAIS